MPPTGQSSRSSTAQHGTAADSPISSASPGTGTAEKPAVAALGQLPVRSVTAPSLVTAAMVLNSHGTIGRSARW